MRSTAPIAAALFAIAFGGSAMAEEVPGGGIHTQWKKFCFNDQKTDFKRICETRAEVRNEDDNYLIAAVELIDREGEAGKILRVTFPLGMQLKYGTRLIVYGNDPLQSPYVTCPATGCISDYEATPALLASMKAGRQLLVQAINLSGKPFNAAFWLADFSATFDGPPTEPIIENVAERRRKPWLDDTLRPELRPRAR
jgi:invasion protein IalB